jgi:hypothetical protein
MRALPWAVHTEIAPLFIVATGNIHGHQGGGQDEDRKAISQINSNAE